MTFISLLDKVLLTIYCLMTLFYFLGISLGLYLIYELRYLNPCKKELIKLFQASIRDGFLILLLWVLYNCSVS